MKIEIAEPTEAEFPIAFILENLEKKFSPQTSEVRYWKGNCYYEGSCGPKENMDYFLNFCILPNGASAKYSNENDVKQEITANAARYVLFKGKFWYIGEDPMYHIVSIDPHVWVGSGSRDSDGFNAFEKDIVFDTLEKEGCVREWIEKIKAYKMPNIKILIPEAVKEPTHEERLQEKFEDKYKLRLEEVIDPLNKLILILSDEMARRIKRTGKPDIKLQDRLTSLSKAIDDVKKCCS